MLLTLKKTIHNRNQMPIWRWDREMKEIYVFNLYFKFIALWEKCFFLDLIRKQKIKNKYWSKK